MLFGDWGTSRLYVLGLAFVMLKREATPHASFWYVAAMCVLVTLVGFSYTIICKHFPDGGGVYSASKHRSKTLAVIGALLLIADYIITASLSAYEGFRYMLPHGVGEDVALYLALASLMAIGCFNIFGPKRVGTLALIVAIIAGVFYFITGAACLPHLSAAKITAPTEPFSFMWGHFVGVILALSGVEAIANMTGVMAEPVARNASKAILVVLLEVVVLNLVMAGAMNALPTKAFIIDGENAGHAIVLPETQEQLARAESKIAGLQTYRAYLTDPVAIKESEAEIAKQERRLVEEKKSIVKDSQDHMLKLVSTAYVGPLFATISSFFFGLLLLSASNSAIGGMVSVQYLLARDKELPSFFTLLNTYGMPWVGLTIATVVPTVLLLFIGSDTEMLADLYAIGVVGAITINMLACGTNKDLELAGWERTVLLVVGLVVAFIELSIAYDKPKALLFAMSVVAVGLTGRFAARREWQQVGLATAGIVLAIVAFMALPYEHANGIVTAKLEVSHWQSFAFTAMILAGIGVANWRVKAPTEIILEPKTSKTEIRRREQSAIRAAIPANAPRLLVPTRGSHKLIKFAASYAKDKKAALFVLFVREVALMIRERGESVASETMTLSNDEEAKKVFADARKVCDDLGVPMAQLYAVHDSAADLILDHAATLGVDAVIMGVSKRGALWKTLRGDVIKEVVEYLPDSIPLLIHA